MLKGERLTRPYDDPRNRKFIKQWFDNRNIKTPPQNMKTHKNWKVLWRPTLPSTCTSNTNFFIPYQYYPDITDEVILTTDQQHSSYHHCVRRATGSAILCGTFHNQTSGIMKCWSYFQCVIHVIFVTMLVYWIQRKT